MNLVRVQLVSIKQHHSNGILDKLQPHPNLQQLSIISYPGVRFPNWLGDPSVLNNLMSLELRGCGNCSTLPPVGQLTYLKCLEISSMARVEHVGSEFYDLQAKISPEQLWGNSHRYREQIHPQSRAIQPIRSNIMS